MKYSHSFHCGVLFVCSERREKPILTLREYANTFYHVCRIFFHASKFTYLILHGAFMIAVYRLQREKISFWLWLLFTKSVRVKPKGQLVLCKWLACVDCLRSAILSFFLIKREINMKRKLALLLSMIWFPCFVQFSVKQFLLSTDVWNYLSLGLKLWRTNREHNEFFRRLTDEFV